MIWALLAEFRTADELLAAARAARAAGFSRLEAYAPYDVEGLGDAVGVPRGRIPLVTLLAALAGGVGGYALQWYSAVVSFPYDIGGRPAHSWPMFVPVSFELAVLCGALAAFVAALAGGGLPQLFHPVFAAPDFGLASRDRFFLALRADDPRFEPRRAAAFLDGLHPVRRTEVER